MTLGIEIIGFLAGGLTTASFVPQVYKTWKTKSTKNLSLTMLFLFFIGISLWFTYGIFVNSLAMIVTNAITAILSIILIYFKFKYR